MFYDSSNLQVGVFRNLAFCLARLALAWLVLKPVRNATLARLQKQPTPFLTSKVLSFRFT